MTSYFRTVLCVDGSATKQSKRPVYCVTVENGKSTIVRWRQQRGVLALCDTDNANLPSPILVTVDVPIGLPSEFNEVYKGCEGFVDWLSQRGNDWRRLVANSVADQTAQSPFVVCKKGETKYSGIFPLRRCEQLTNGESLYWCVGGKQVGKAALQFWHDTLIPLRAHFAGEIAIWPFEEAATKKIVVAECYPAMLYRRVWGRRVTKSNPCDVVDALADKRYHNPSLCCDKTWLHAVSSEDEFDMFTTALAIAQVNGDVAYLFTNPQLDTVCQTEGWMIALSEDANRQ